jgi:thiol-disulfide isomerase/thioredoxin
MPEISSLLGMFGCKTCTSSDPYFVLLGAGYFALIIALSVLFPSFPGPLFAKGGLVWSLLLMIGLTYESLPNVCWNCLFTHVCNVLIWGIWLYVPVKKLPTSTTSLPERMYLALFAPIGIIALFGSLNLISMAYGFKIHHGFNQSLQSGEQIPSFTVQTTKGTNLTSADMHTYSGMVINFVAPNCPFCKEQLPIVDKVAIELASPHRFFHVSPKLPLDLVELSPTADWIEDKEGKLRSLFKVSGYPTLFIIDSDGKIAEVIPGVPDSLRNSLLQHL